MCTTHSGTFVPLYVPQVYHI